MSEEEKTFRETITADVERMVTSEGSSRRLAVALKMFKEVVMKLSAKKVLILSDWLVKWGLYLQNELNFTTKNLKAYKQREIILVDFGFNVGGEFGGRHYAVVLEKNNNPTSSVILVAPITSYETERGCHPTNVDLGVGAINGHDKGAAVVMNQVRYVSKMRIEKPKTSFEKIQYMNRDKFGEVVKRLQRKILP